MKKAILSLLIFALMLLFGCANNTNSPANEASYDAGFEDGRSEGYSEGYKEGHFDGYEEAINSHDYEEKRTFSSVIITLVYDKEFEIVSKLYDYYPRDVADALEEEFGTSNLNVIIDYIENQ